MSKIFKYRDLIIYVSSRCVGEPMHIHVSKGRPRKGDTKYWIVSDGLRLERAGYLNK